MALLLLIGELLILILKEYFTFAGRAREEEKQFKLDQATWGAIVKTALAKMRKDAGQDSGQAGSVEDQVDEDLKNGGSNGTA